MKLIRRSGFEQVKPLREKKVKSPQKNFDFDKIAVIIEITLGVLMYYICLVTD